MNGAGGTQGLLAGTGNELEGIAGINGPHAVLPIVLTENDPVLAQNLLVPATEDTRDDVAFSEELNLALPLSVDHREGQRPPFKVIRNPVVPIPGKDAPAHLYIIAESYLLHDVSAMTYYCFCYDILLYRYDILKSHNKGLSTVMLHSAHTTSASLPLSSLQKSVAS